MRARAARLRALNRWHPHWARGRLKRGRLLLQRDLTAVLRGRAVNADDMGGKRTARIRLKHEFGHSLDRVLLLPRVKGH